MELDSQQVEALRRRVDQVSYATVAREMGVHRDTVRRMVARYGIRNIMSVRHVSPVLTETWIKACLSCGDTTVRPKNWYYCPACRKAQGFSEWQWPPKGGRHRLSA